MIGSCNIKQTIFSKIQFSELNKKRTGYCTKQLRGSPERLDYTFRGCAESQAGCMRPATSKFGSAAMIKDIIVNNCINLRRTRKCQARIEAHGGLLLRQRSVLEKALFALLFVNLARAFLSNKGFCTPIEHYFRGAEHL